MAQGQGIVASVNQDGWAKVLTERNEAHAEGTVSHCCKPSGPGSRMVVRAKNKAGAKTGDVVTLDMGSGTVVLSALLVYLMPMVGLVFGAVLGTVLHQGIGLGETLAAILFGTCGFAVAFIVTRVASGRMGTGGRLTPIITGVVRRGFKEAVPRVAVDPVCNMVVNPAQAAARGEYQGKMVYFCHPGCRETFQKDPEKYL